VGLYVPAVLEPDLDLLGLDVAEDGAVPDELLPAQRGWLGALAVDALQRLHLLRRVPHVLARVHVRRRGGGGAPRHRRHSCCTGPRKRTGGTTARGPGRRRELPWLGGVAVVVRRRAAGWLAVMLAQFHFTPRPQRSTVPIVWSQTLGLVKV
jgi:hypothetical protein